MNKLILAFITLLIIIANVEGQWEILNEGKGGFGLIGFVNDNVGWISNRNSIMKTGDGGETWNTISVEENARNCDVDFIDEFTGWVLYNLGDEGYEIKKTINGGQSWETLGKWTDKELYMAELFVVNDSVLYIKNSNFVRKTKDGGRNWIDITPNILQVGSIWFINPDFGFVICWSGSEWILMKTSNGGENWNEIQTPEFQSIHDIQFIDDSTGYFWATTDSFQYFCKTTDTLNTWTAVNQDFDIHSYAIFKEDTIFAIKRRFGGTNSDRIMISMDAGLTWKAMPHTAAGYPVQIYISPSHDIYLVNQVGTGFAFTISSSLWKSSDLGENWTLQILSYPFNDVWFMNNNTGFIFGGWGDGSPHTWFTSGEIFVSNDGGMNWINQHKTDDNIKAVFFTDDKTGFILNGSNISKTIDSGENWFDVYVNNPDSMGYSFNGADIYFEDKQTGFVAGSYNLLADTSGAGILGTTDNGESWDLVWKITDEDSWLNSIHGSDSSVWAVGEMGLMAKYTPQNQWQLQPSVTDLRLNDIFFSDEQHGWIAGGYLHYGKELQSIILRSIDTGKTWTEIRFDKYLINDMYFVNNLHGWAVGSDTSYNGMILETFNGGDTWNTQMEDLSSSLSTIHFKGGYGWAVGGLGLVLRTDDGATWVDQKIGKTYPNKFNLSQNYPNPFNPTTTIQFELPKTSKVTLKIFNILGKEVTTVVSDRLNAGSYTYEWDASNMASGICTGCP